MDETKRARTSGWTWLGVWLILLPVLYVASFGPVCWFTTSMTFKAPVHPVMYAYWPMARVMLSGPRPIREAAYWWAALGIPDGHAAFIPMNLNGTHQFVIGDTSKFV